MPTYVESNFYKNMFLYHEIRKDFENNPIFRLYLALFSSNDSILCLDVLILSFTHNCKIKIMRPRLGFLVL